MRVQPARLAGQEKDLELRVKRLFQRFGFSEIPSRDFLGVASHP
jgi:hypothetical protein